MDDRNPDQTAATAPVASSLLSDAPEAEALSVDAFGGPGHGDAFSSEEAVADSVLAEDDGPDYPASSYRLSRDRRYFTWLTSDFMTGLAGALAGFAVPLIALAVTGSPGQAGVIGAVGLVVRLISIMVGGVLADRHDRVRLMMWGSALGLVLALGLVAFAVTGSLSFVSLLALNVFLAVRLGVFGSAAEAVVKDIVPAEGIGRAQAANQGRDAALSLAGGPIGGILLAVGAWLVGAVMAACQVIALLMAFVLRRSVPRGMPDAGRPAGKSASAWTDAKEGVLWLFRREDLRGVAIISTVINLGFNAGLTTVIYALQLEGSSPQTIGGLTAAIGAVMLVGAAVSPMIVTRARAGAVAITGLVLAALGMLLLPLVSSIPAIVGVLAAGVVLLPALNAGLMGYMMVATPSELLGRVTSAAGVMAMGAMPLAPLIAGFGLEWIGRTGTLFIAGAICVVAVGMTLAARPLRALPKEADWQDHAEQFA